MSALKQYIKQKLQNRVGPDVLGNLDVHVFGAIMDLQSKDLIPPRTIEFKSIERKKEHRLENEEVQYYYYTLPKDFQILHEFHPYVGEPYFEAETLNTIIQHKNKNKWFTVTQKHFDEDSKFESILVAKPFPKDDTIIRISYYTDGSDTNWSWITQKYWNAVLAQVQFDLGVVPKEHADEQANKVVYRDKNTTSKKKSLKKKTPTFFGNKRWRG